MLGRSASATHHGQTSNPLGWYLSFPSLSERSTAAHADAPSSRAVVQWLIEWLEHGLHGRSFLRTANPADNFHAARPACVEVDVVELDVVERDLGVRAVGAEQFVAVGEARFLDRHVERKVVPPFCATPRPKFWAVKPSIDSVPPALTRKILSCTS